MNCSMATLKYMSRPLKKSVLYQYFMILCYLLIYVRIYATFIMVTQLLN